MADGAKDFAVLFMFFLCMVDASFRMHGIFIVWMEEKFSGPPGRTGYAAVGGGKKKNLFIYRGFSGSKTQKTQSF
jgi:nitrate reductase NapE component